MRRVCLVPLSEESDAFCFADLVKERRPNAGWDGSIVGRLASRAFSDQELLELNVVAQS